VPVFDEHPAAATARTIRNAANSRVDFMITSAERGERARCLPASVNVMGKRKAEPLYSIEICGKDGIDGPADSFRHHALTDGRLR
jgi:hypothetical protein